MVAVALDEKWAIVSGSLVGGRRLVLFRFFQEGHYLFTMLASLPACDEMARMKQKDKKVMRVLPRRDEQPGQLVKMTL